MKNFHQIKLNKRDWLIYVCSKAIYQIVCPLSLEQENNISCEMRHTLLDLLSRFNSPLDARRISYTIYFDVSNFPLSKTILRKCRCYECKDQLYNTTIDFSFNFVVFDLLFWRILQEPCILLLCIVVYSLCIK